MDINDMIFIDKCEHQDCKYEKVEYKIGKDCFGHKYLFGICPICKRFTEIKRSINI